MLSAAGALFLFGFGTKGESTASPSPLFSPIIPTEKRGGNLASWHWYFKDVLIPHLQSCRLACGGNETDVIFVSLDGEKLILDAIMDVVDPATGKNYLLFLVRSLFFLVSVGVTC